MKKFIGSFFMEEGKKIVIEYILVDKLDYLGVVGDILELMKVEG